MSSLPRAMSQHKLMVSSTNVTLSVPLICTLLDRQHAWRASQPAVTGVGTHSLLAPTRTRLQHSRRRTLTVVASRDLQSEAERFVATLKADGSDEIDVDGEDPWDAKHQAQLRSQILELRAEVHLCEGVDVHARNIRRKIAALPLQGMYHAFSCRDVTLFAPLADHNGAFLKKFFASKLPETPQNPRRAASCFPSTNFEWVAFPALCYSWTPFSTPVVQPEHTTGTAPSFRSAPLDQESRLSATIDTLYDSVFSGLEIQVPLLEVEEKSGATATSTTEASDTAAAEVAVAPPSLETLRYDRMTEPHFSDLGRSRPAAAVALMTAAAAAGPDAWRSFQSQART